MCSSDLPVYIQQVVSNLLFTYSGWDFAPPASTYGFREMKDLGSPSTSADGGKEVAEYFSLLHVCRYQLLRYRISLLI